MPLDKSTSWTLFVRCYLFFVLPDSQDKNISHGLDCFFSHSFLVSAFSLNFLRAFPIANIIIIFLYGSYIITKIMYIITLTVARFRCIRGK